MAESAEEAAEEEENEQQQQLDDVNEIVLSDDEQQQQQQQQQYSHSRSYQRQQYSHETDGDDGQVVGAMTRKRERQQAQGRVTLSDDDEVYEERQVEEEFISEDEQRMDEWAGDEGWKQAVEEEDDELTIVSAVKRRKVRGHQPSTASRQPSAMARATNGAHGQSQSPSAPAVPASTVPTAAHHSQERAQPSPAASPVADVASPSAADSSSSSSSLRPSSSSSSPPRAVSVLPFTSAVSASCSPAPAWTASPEPAVGAAVVRIQFRLPGGSTVQRRFLASSTASTLRSFVAHSLQQQQQQQRTGAAGGRSNMPFRVLSLHPRQEVDLQSDSQSTLQSLNVGNATLIVELTD